MSKVEEERLAIPEAVKAGEISNEGGLAEKRSSGFMAIVAGLGALSVAIGAERLAASDRDAAPGALPPVPSDTTPLHGDIMTPQNGKLRLRSQLSTDLERKWATPIQEMSPVDQPDEVAGPLVHAVYVYAADGEAPLAGTNEDIENMLWDAWDWQAGQTNGLSLRADTVGEHWDISQVQSSFTEAQVVEQDVSIVDAFRNELQVQGFSSSDQKIILVLYKGKFSRYFGVADWPPAVPGNTAVVSIDNSQSVLNQVITHEALHVTGQAPPSAPHYHPDSPAHVTDMSDVMYPSPLISPPQTIDPGGDDYRNRLDPYLDKYFFPVDILFNGGGKVLFDQSPSKYLGQHETACYDSCQSWFSKGILLGIKADDIRSDAWRFKKWGGACEGQTECSVTVNEPQKVEAVFEPIGNWEVHVLKPGMGTVRAVGQGVCRNVCDYELVAGSKINLIAIPARGYQFKGWRQACSAEKTRRCSVPTAHGKDKVVTAVFSRQASR